jgi:hypothetical protein
MNTTPESGTALFHLSNRTTYDNHSQQMYGGVANRAQRKQLPASARHGSVAPQFKRLDHRLSRRELSPPPVIDVGLENGRYEDHGRPREDLGKLKLGLNIGFDPLHGATTSSTLESEKALWALLANESPYDSPDELYDHPPRPREGVSLVEHNLTESQPATKVVSVEPPPLLRYSSREILTSHSSSSSESLPPPPPPPGPGPGPRPKPSIQVPKIDQPSRLDHVQSPPVKFLELEQISPTRKPFSVRSAQSLQPRSRSRQPRHRESGDDIWKRIKILRAGVWALRSNISENRSVLREKEHAKSVADDNFMKFIRTHGLAKLSRKDKSHEQEILAKLFEECETLRNDYGPLEDDCNLLENILNNREYEMQKLEAALEERWNEAPPSQQVITPPQHLPPPSNYSGSEPSQTFHPLVDAYLSKIGDVQIFRERLEWHSEEKLTLEEEKETKEHVNLKLAEADQKWLDNYAEAEIALIKQFEEAQEEAENLRIQCYSLGLVDEDGEPLDFERQERQTFIEDGVDAGTEKSDFVKFPLLLQNPGNKEAQLPDPIILQAENDKEENIHETQDPNDRINHWLLQTLRSSPLDVNLLVRTFESLCGHIIESERWQLDVLQVWYNDGSKEMATQYSRSQSEVVTHSWQKRAEPQTSLSGRHSIGILVRSSMLRLPNTGEGKAFKVNDYGLLLPSSTVKDSGGKSV